MFCVICGFKNPDTVVGPFASYEEAEEWRQKNDFFYNKISRTPENEGWYTLKVVPMTNPFPSQPDDLPYMR